MRRIEDNKLYKDLIGVSEYARLVPTGELRGVLISGPPGVGKTFLVEQALRESGQKYRLINPTPAAFVEKLYQWRKGGTLMIDDNDSFLRSERMLNTLKRAMDMKDRRQIADDRKVDGRGLFDIQCGLIFLTNIDINDESQFDGAMREHIKAFKSRVYSIRLSFSPIDCYEYTVWLADHRRLLRAEGLSLEASNEVLEYFAENAWRFADHEVSPRRLIKIARLRKASPMWRELLEQDLLAEPWTDLPTPEVVRISPPRAPKPVPVPETRKPAKSAPAPKKPAKSAAATKRGTK